MPLNHTSRRIASLVAPLVLVSQLAHAQIRPQSGKPNAPNTPKAAQPVAPQSPLDKIPKVVAVVNGKTISREQLADACLKRYGTVVLDNLLNKHLILQACAARGVTITQADVNNEIARVAGKFEISTKHFLEAIEQERDITPAQYASEIVWPMLALRQLAADQIQVSTKEIDEIIQREYGPKVQVRMIAVSQAEKAQQLHQQVSANPELFRRVAKEHSEDAASASVEGLLPPIRQYSGDDLLERMAFQLQPDQISPVFPLANLHVILQCVRHLPATPPNQQLLPAIRQRIEDQLRDQRLGEAADGIFASLQQNSQVTAVIGNPDLEAKYPNVAGFINQEPVPRDQLAAECIARHGKQILRGEINRLLLTMALQSENKAIIQPDIDAEVARAADSMGFITRDGKPDTDAWLKSIMEEEGATIELYVADAVWPSVALKKLVEDQVQITQEDLQKGFEANFGPRAEVLAIVMSNQRTAEDVFRQARQNPTEQFFGELAAKYSIESVSRSNFGKVPPLRRFGGQPTLEEEAFKLNSGEMSAVIALSDQYVILYKQGETQPIVQDFEAVRAELEKDIFEKKLRQAMTQKLDALLKSAQIENFIEPMAQLNSAAAAPAPATMPIRR